MQSRYQLYQFILKMLKRLDWHGRPETQCTLAYLMTGIFLAQDVRLSEIARKVPHPIKLDNIVQRMRRFLKNERLDAQAIYAPVTGSMERSAQEHSDLMAQAGFRMTGVVSTNAPGSIVEAVAI